MSIILDNKEMKERLKEVRTEIAKLEIMIHDLLTEEIQLTKLIASTAAKVDNRRKQKAS